MTKQTKSRGFTIVELLIVIVIIAILAAITIVAYTGITTRANASAAKSNAETVAKVAAAYAADDQAGNGVYAPLATLQTYNGVSRIPTGLTLQAAALTNAASNGKTLQYMVNSASTGACIGYWDGSLTPAAEAWYYVGATSTATGTTCS